VEEGERRRVGGGGWVEEGGWRKVGGGGWVEEGGWKRGGEGECEEGIEQYLQSRRYNLKHD
jgi:hypothetical protein